MAIGAAVVAVAGLLRIAAGEASPDGTTTSSEPAPTSSTTEVVETSTTSTTTTTSTTAKPGPELPAGTDAVVESITDGDTLRVTGGERVRLIGIDAPEASGPVECFSTEATAHLTELTPPGTAVRLVKDVDPTDQYHRTLAYLYRSSDGLFVNTALANDGYASQLTVPPNVAHADEIRDAVAAARAAGRGMWSACPDPDATTTTSTTTTTTTTTEPPPVLEPVVPAPQPSNCDPSYPDFCIPPPPPDLDCRDIPHNNFTVLAPDPHRFDADHDGIGCES